MEYELAKRLKDAGFPQFVSTRATGLDKDNQTHPYMKEQPEGVVYLPTLAELIEACGEQFFRLSHSSNTDETEWDCESWNMGEGEIETGSTPEEAVANLWLALNKCEGCKNQHEGDTRHYHYCLQYEK